MIRRVVVPLDGSDLATTALAPAQALAEAAGATLVLMTAEPMPTWHEQPERAAAYLREQATSTGFERVETRVVDDQARHQAILAAAEAEGSVVCMATHGRGGVSEAVLGSTAEAVVREARQPLLLVGPHARIPARPFPHGDLVITVDGSASAESIVRVASEWARCFDLRPCVVEVRAPPRRAQAEDNPSAEGAGARRVAEALPVDPARRVWEVLHGSDVAEVIVHYAQERPASLIAMATHGRTGLARLALGSVSTGVVRESPCPVLVRRVPYLTG